MGTRRSSCDAEILCAQGNCGVGECKRAGRPNRAWAGGTVSTSGRCSRLSFGWPYSEKCIDAGHLEEPPYVSIGRQEGSVLHPELRPVCAPPQGPTIRLSPRTAARPGRSRYAAHLPVSDLPTPHTAGRRLRCRVHPRASQGHAEAHPCESRFPRFHCEIYEAPTNPHSVFLLGTPQRRLPGLRLLSLPAGARLVASDLSWSPFPTPSSFRCLGKWASFLRRRQPDEMRTERRYG